MSRVAMPRKTPAQRKGEACRSGAAFMRDALDKLRGDAITSDDYHGAPANTVKGGGQTREHFVLAAAEWAEKAAILEGMADTIDSEGAT